MKAEWRIFGMVAAFLFVMCALYAWWSGTYFHDQADAAHHIDWVGTVALALSGLLCLMCGTYFWFVSTRIDLRPEDRADAEIADGAGEVGFFSPGSYWPFGLALCALFTAFGIAVWQPWIFGAGLLAIIVAASGMLFEYYSGSRRASH
jgi:formate hydrogenlyase subunit 3/multisubunit Na+/H+ antiporter MnhD subunit